MINITVKKLIIYFLVSVPVLYVLKVINKKILFKKRKKISLEQIYVNEIKNTEIKRDTFLKVYGALERFYNINVTLISPTDSWNKFLDLDSWNFDEGTEKFEDWLRNNFELPASFKKPDTIFDLLIMLEKVGPRTNK